MAWAESRNTILKVLGFERAVRSFRDPSSANMESTARIALTSPVKTHIHGKQNREWSDDSTRLLYVD